MAALARARASRSRGAAERTAAGARSGSEAAVAEGNAHVVAIHLGSRARLITGAQKVPNVCPVFMKTRASRPMARPVACQSDLLNDIAVVIGNLGPAGRISSWGQLFKPSRARNEIAVRRNWAWDLNPTAEYV